MGEKVDLKKIMRVRLFLFHATASNFLTAVKVADDWDFMVVFNDNM